MFVATGSEINNLEIKMIKILEKLKHNVPELSCCFSVSVRLYNEILNAINIFQYLKTLNFCKKTRVNIVCIRLLLVGGL